METMPYLAIRSAASLIVLERGFVRNYPLDAKNLWRIGRKNPETENDIELESKIVSRKHGYIQNIDGEWYYVESGSLNGTYYNGKKIAMNENSEYEAVKLSNGDILRVDSDNLENPEERGVLLIFTTEGIGNQWKTITLRKAETVFGRNAECDVTIPLSYISARHMVVRKKEAEYFLMDCDSMAGTWVNGQEVHGEVPLKEKDTISICDCTMILTENKIIYNIPVIRKNKSNMSEMSQNSMEENNLQDRPVVLAADIKSKKVKNNQGFGKKELIRDIKVEIREGTLVALIGGTGAGKSTVMGMISRLVAKDQGLISFYGKDLEKWNSKELSKHLAILTQSNQIQMKLTVEELVAFGRFPHSGGRMAKEDEEKINQAITYMELDEFRNRFIDELSGGQRQRAYIAMVIAQDTEFVLLDEPTNNLDIYHATNLMKIVRRLCDELDKTVIMVLHEINYAAFYSDYICAFKEGRIAKYGTVEEVITKEVLSEIYQVDFEILNIQGKPLSIYY